MNAWIWLKMFMNPWLWIRHLHELMNMNWEIMNSMNMKFGISWKVHMNRVSCMNQGLWKIWISVGTVNPVGPPLKSAYNTDQLLLHEKIHFKIVVRRCRSSHTNYALSCTLCSRCESIATSPREGGVIWYENFKLIKVIFLVQENFDVDF